jgi:hypothetical protein
MKVNVEANPSLDACTITHEAVRLETVEDVSEWRTQLMAEMEAVVGFARVYLLVDYAGFWVHPGVAEAYGKVAEELRQRFAKEVFRYGVTDPLSAASARLQSMKRAHRSNVFPTRAQAVAALNKLREAR